jgi:hypothetical protein
MLARRSCWYNEGFMNQEALPSAEHRALIEEIERLKAESARINSESLRLRQDSANLMDAIDRLQRRLVHEGKPPTRS